MFIRTQERIADQCGGQPQLCLYGHDAEKDRFGVLPDRAVTSIVRLAAVGSRSRGGTVPAAGARRGVHAGRRTKFRAGRDLEQVPRAARGRPPENRAAGELYKPTEVGNGTQLAGGADGQRRAAES
jgi:hypothetical protein